MKGWLLAGTALAMPMTGVSAQTVTSTEAAAAAAASDEANGDIVVTAQRRAERLQEVPIAVSAYSADRRDLLGIVNAQDIAKYTPGVSFSEFPNRLFVRGIGRFTNQLGSDPGVATYVDGFYTSETSALGSSPILVGQIEFLRGPQGTLYGRNAIGGAVNITSQRPTREMTGQVRMLGAAYGTIGGAASVAGPIADGLRFRATGVGYNQSRGYLRNDAGGNYNRTRFQVLEGQLEADVGSGGTIWAKYQYFNQSNRPVLSNQIDPYDTTTYFAASSLVPSPTYGLTAPNPGVGDLLRASLNYTGYERVRGSHQVVVNASWDFGGATAKYIGGYQTFDYSRTEDYDRTSRLSYDFYGQRVSTNLINEITDDKSFFSHELNLTSNGSGPLKFVAGLYFYREKETQTYSLLSPDQPQLGNVLTPTFTLSSTYAPVFGTAAPNPRRAFLDFSARQRSTSYAAFGQVDYQPVPEITLTGGLRYTRDEKRGSESRRYVLWGPFLGSTLATSFYGSIPTIPASFLPTLAAALDNAMYTSSFDVSPAIAARDVRNDWEALSGKAGVAWTPDRTTNLYASYSRGYKSGGYNLYNFTDPVEKETLNAYELGLKKSWANRFSVNLAGFYYDYRNLQVPVSFINVVLQQNFVNAPRARSLGAEAEVSWAPTQSLQFLLTYGYLDAQFRRFGGFLDVTNPAAGNQNLRGNRIPQSPRHKITGNVLNRFELGGTGTLTPIATVSYTSAQYYAPFTTDRYRQDGFVRADFRLVYQDKASGLQVNAYLNNAFDKRSFNGFQLGPEASGFARQVTGNLPRAYGIELIGRF